MGTCVCKSEEKEDSETQNQNRSNERAESQGPQNERAESQGPQRRDVPKDEYHVEEVDCDAVDIVLTSSTFLRHDYNGQNDPLRDMDQNNRQLVEEAGMRIERESQTTRRNLKLRIKLYDREGLTADILKYIELTSGTGENTIECYRQVDGTIRWRYNKIPPEVHELNEISVSSLLEVLNASQCLQHESNQGIFKEVSNRVAREPVDKMKNCELTIILHNGNGDVNNCVKRIVIRSGQGKYEMKCSNITNGDIHWDVKDRTPVLDENYTFSSERGLDIDYVLAESKFLEKRSYRAFVSSLRVVAERDYSFVRTNCKLTIKLDNPEDTSNISPRKIIIRVGNGDNEIVSTETHPWQIIKRTEGANLADAGATAYNATFGRLFNGVGYVAMKAIGY